MTFWPWLVAGAMLLAVVAMFNLMIRPKNTLAFAFASIDTMLKQRYDLVPNRVDVCKGYMQYERAVLAEITETRANAMQATEDVAAAMGYETKRMFEAPDEERQPVNAWGR